MVSPIHIQQELDQKAMLESSPEMLSSKLSDLIRSFANPANLQLLRSYTESHTDTITSLRFHHASSPLTATTTTPSNPQLQLISSSTDGLVNIYDPSLSDEDDAVLVVFNNKAAVSHACPFLAAPTPTSPSAGGAPAICAISHDEKLSVYEIEDKSLKGEEEVTWPEVDVREALNADYAISLLPQTGRGESNGQTMMLAVGAYREETLAKVPGVTRPYVDLCMGAPKQAATQGSPPSSGFELAIRLVGGHGEEVVRDVWFDQEVGCRILLQIQQSILMMSSLGFIRRHLRRGWLHQDLGRSEWPGAIGKWRRRDGRHHRRNHAFE